LLYAHRDQLSRSGVLVVGPNESFLGYIGDVLPALGEIDARQTTAEGLLRESTGAKVRGVDNPAVATLKGDARLAEVLARALWSSISEAKEPLAVPYGSRVVRVPAHGIAAAIASLRDRGVRYESGRKLLSQRLAHEVLLRLEAQGETTDDRVQNAVARAGPVRSVVAAVWPLVTPAGLLFRLWTDAEALAAAADGILSESEQAMLTWSAPPRTAGSAKWSLPDLALLDELGDLLDRTGSVGHVILDEAQDLSPMALRAVGRRATTGSITVLGDLAQATTPWGARDWGVALAHLGKPDADVTELTEGFRVPGAVIEYAARLLPSIAPGLTAPRSVRHNRGDLDLRLVGEPVMALADAAAEMAVREGTVGVIVADPQLAAARTALAHIPYIELGQASTTEAFEAHLDLVPASLAKGLEFDHVLLVDPAAIVAAEADELTGWRRLYVCLTRAVTSLVVLHDGNLPAPLL
jgi:DNA helicase IV